MQNILDCDDDKEIVKAIKELYKNRLQNFYWFYFYKDNI